MSWLVIVECNVYTIRVTSHLVISSQPQNCYFIVRHVVSVAQKLRRGGGRVITRGPPQIGDGAQKQNVKITSTGKGEEGPGVVFLHITLPIVDYENRNRPQFLVLPSLQAS